MIVQINIEIPDEKWEDWWEGEYIRHATREAANIFEGLSNGKPLEKDVARTDYDSFLQTNTELGKIITNIKLE